MTDEGSAKYSPEVVSGFYDRYGEEEWARLEATAKGRLMLEMHLRFLNRHLPRTGRVLDAGCGPGRFAIALARHGLKITLFDISPTQLHLAREKLAAEGLGDQVEAFLEGDICDMSSLTSASFDVTLCFGGALNYVVGGERQAICELVRMTKPGGKLLVGVMSLWGAVRYGVAVQGLQFIGQAEKNRIWEVLATGTIPPLDHVRHPTRHLYTSGEIKALLETAGCEVLDLASTPCIAAGVPGQITEIAQDPVAWENLLAVEEQASHQPGLLDAGEHLLVAARVKQG